MKTIITIISGILTLVLGIIGIVASVDMVSFGKYCYFTHLTMIQPTVFNIIFFFLLGSFFMFLFAYILIRSFYYQQLED